MAQELIIDNLAFGTRWSNMAAHRTFQELTVRLRAHGRGCEEQALASPASLLAYSILTGLDQIAFLHPVFQGLE